MNCGSTVFSNEEKGRRPPVVLIIKLDDIISIPEKVSTGMPSGTKFRLGALRIQKQDDCIITPAELGEHIFSHLENINHLELSY